MMKRKMLACLALAAGMGLGTSVVAQEETQRSSNPATKLRLDRLHKTAEDEVIIAAVEKQNARKRTPQQIQAVEMGWGLKPDQNPQLFARLTNACAERLKQQTNTDFSIKELMVMDNQGALVCITHRTSDYWQGDEDKWSRSFAEGAGAVFVDKPRPDESTGVMLVQISVPIMVDDQAIGVVTAGIAADALK